jgi:hypothetical protein
MGSNICPKGLSLQEHLWNSIDIKREVESVDELIIEGW